MSIVSVPTNIRPDWIGFPRDKHFVGLCKSDEEKGFINEPIGLSHRPGWKGFPRDKRSSLFGSCIIGKDRVI